MLETAKEHIEGKITISEADKRIRSYYEERGDRTEIESDTKEADIVSVRIAELLGEKTFQFSPVTWQNIHRKLFEGVFSHAGKIRDYNITKKEWVLKGDTVMYASYDNIRDTLDYDTESVTQSAKDNILKCKNGTLKLSLEELAIINVLKNNPTATQKQIAEATGKSERTIKRRTVEMQEKGLISRENGKRNGKWIILRDGH